MCRYGELALKGKNRAIFENKLVDNLRNSLKSKSIKAMIEKVRGRIFIYTEDTKAIDVIKNNFGLISISPCITCKSTPEDIKSAVMEYSDRAIMMLRPKTFRMTTKRIDKSFPKKSNEMDILLGDSVDDSLEVDLKNPDLNIGVEIHDKTFIFHERISCYGGLPLGITGNVAVLMEDDKSIAAAWLLMKRGCTILPFVLKEKQF
jgi:thiamine biosynthesis protein ThiI